MSLKFVHTKDYKLKLLQYQWWCHHSDIVGMCVHVGGSLTNEAVMERPPKSTSTCFIFWKWKKFLPFLRLIYKSSDCLILFRSNLVSHCPVSGLKSGVRIFPPPLPSPFIIRGWRETRGRRKGRRLRRGNGGGVGWVFQARDGDYHRSNMGILFSFATREKETGRII